MHEVLLSLKKYFLCKIMLYVPITQRPSLPSIMAGGTQLGAFSITLFLCNTWENAFKFPDAKSILFSYKIFLSLTSKEKQKYGKAA